MPQASQRHGKKGDSGVLNGGVLCKVRTQSVVSKGKVLVPRDQSQKPGLQIRDTRTGLSVWEASPAWGIPASRVRPCSKAESVRSLHFTSRPTGVHSGEAGKGRRVLLTIPNSYHVPSPVLGTLWIEPYLISIKTI